MRSAGSFPGRSLTPIGGPEHDRKLSPGLASDPASKLEIERLARALRETEAAYREAIEQGAGGRRRAEKEVLRLRRLIRGFLSASQPGFQCPSCGKPGSRHSGGCPWPALVAEAEKP